MSRAKFAVMHGQTIAQLDQGRHNIQANEDRKEGDRQGQQMSDPGQPQTSDPQQQGIVGLFLLRRQRKPTASRQFALLGLPLLAKEGINLFMHPLLIVIIQASELRAADFDQRLPFPPTLRLINQRADPSLGLCGHCLEGLAKSVQAD